MLNVPRALAVGRELRRLGVRRVHALWASLPATLGWIIARAFDMEFSFAAHARDVYVDGRMLKEKAALARHVMMCSEVSAAHLKGIVGEDLARKITIVRHGIDIEKLPARAEKPTDMILAAGRFEPKKGFDVLIEACRILARRGRHLHCTIVGEGPLQKHLEDLVARSGVTGIELKPWMNHDALMDLVAQAGVVVTPSVVASSGDRDGVPNILLEAMAIGTPVVASAVGGVGEVVHDGETGHLVAPGDAEHLADAIEAALAEGTTAGQETGKMSEKSASARELIRREYALPDTVQTLERLLTD
jgi:glycosyltransferase involved in cell wall biosynthesis